MVNVAVQIGFVEYCLIWADYSSTCGKVTGYGNVAQSQG